MWAAKLNCAVLASRDVPQDRTTEGFMQWLRDQGVEGIYVDHDLYNGLPAVWNMIEPQIGVGLERIFEVDRGNYQILVI